MLNVAERDPRGLSDMHQAAKPSLNPKLFGVQGVRCRLAGNSGTLGYATFLVCCAVDGFSGNYLGILMYGGRAMPNIL